MRTTHILILFLGLTSLLSAQKEDYQWYFNRTSVDNCLLPQFEHLYEICGESILDFNVDPPIFVSEKIATLDMHATHASICDAEGQLLLYSNGMSIHGPDHDFVPGGEMISYGPRWTQNTWLNEHGDIRSSGFLGIDCAAFIPDPGDKDRMYLVYYNFDDFFINDAFKKLYAIIDISNNEPEVIASDIVLMDKTTEPGHSSAAQHANGRDWWLLQYSRDTVYSFLIDPSGIKLDHTSVLPFEFKPNQSAVSYNPTADKYVVFELLQNSADTGAVLTLLDFDRCTGDVSRPLRDTFSTVDQGIVHGVAFSPLGQYLYASNQRTCFQYDMWSADILASRDTVMVWDGTTYFTSPTSGTLRRSFFGHMQLGPDRKLYMSEPGQGNRMHIIHEPDQPAAFCRPEQNAMIMPTTIIGTLPTMPTLRLGPLDGSSCDTLGLDNNPVSRFRYEQDTLDFKDISFVDLSYFEPTSWEWDFGDGMRSIEPSPFHAYAEDGIYEVCLTVSNEYSADISCDTLFLGVTSLADQTEDRHISIYPNPVEDLTRVAIHDYLPQAAVMRIYNQSGQLVQTATLTGVTTTVDMSALMSGVYVYEVWDGAKRLSGGKVFKM